MMGQICSIATWHASRCRYDTKKKTAGNLSLMGPFCVEFSFRVHKQLSKKDDTARKKVFIKSFTNSLKN